MLKGTKFQIMVWNELKKIPEGEVRTYKEIALAIGKPNSARAVGSDEAEAFTHEHESAFDKGYHMRTPQVTQEGYHTV